MPCFEPQPTIPLDQRSAAQIDRAFDAWRDVDLPVGRRIRALEFATALHLRDYRFRPGEAATQDEVVADVIATAAVFEAYLADGIPADAKRG